MCIHFRSARTADIEAILAEDIQGDVFADQDVWPHYSAPIIRYDHEKGKRIVEAAKFGIVPVWWKKPDLPRNTQNARNETIAELPSYKASWTKARFCLVPVTKYFEPHYATAKSKSENWSIQRNDSEAFCVAAIWAWWPGFGANEGGVTFSLITMNCDEHPILKRFHKPGDEKRSLVHILPDEYDAWLTASSDLARVMLALPEATALSVAPAPLPPRTKKSPAA